MDPLSITAAAGSLAGTVLTLTKTIGAFVATARDSRNELEAVSRELISLQVCLDVLESDRKHGIRLGDSLEASLNQILVNIQLCCGQIGNLLAKCRSSRLGRPIKWAIQQKDEVNRLRSSLETHKTALQMTLQLNTVSILVRETRGQSAAQTSPEQDDRNYTAMQQISQRIDDVARMQDSSLSLQRIEDALAELSASIQEIASKHPSIESFSLEGCAFAADAVATVSHLEGVSELRTKIEAMIENPFVDPFAASDTQSGFQNHSVNEESRLKTAFCPVCAESLTEEDSVGAQGKIQQLQAHWRGEWLSQLKQELTSFNHRDGSSSTHPNHEGSGNALLGDAELSDLLSETMTITSWNDIESRYEPSEARTVPSNTSSARFSASSELRQLRSKYESASRRVKILTEEISAAENEIDNLQETHERDIMRWKARLARVRPSSTGLASLEHENDDLRQKAEQAAAALQDREKLILRHENEIYGLKSTIEELSVKLDHAQSDLSSTGLKLRDTEKAKAEFEAEVASWRGELRDTRVQLNSVTKEPVAKRKFTPMIRAAMKSSGGARASQALASPALPIPLKTTPQPRDTSQFGSSQMKSQVCKHALNILHRRPYQNLDLITLYPSHPPPASCSDGFLIASCYLRNDFHRIFCCAECGLAGCQYASPRGRPCSSSLYAVKLADPTDVSDSFFSSILLVLFPNGKNPFKEYSLPKLSAAFSDPTLGYHHYRQDQWNSLDLARMFERCDYIKIGWEWSDIRDWSSNFPEQ